jgi:hypothetical protein
MTAKITKTFVIYWCFLICLGSPVMASSLADKYEDQKNNAIEINPDVQAYIEAREADNRLVMEKGKLHIIGRGYPKAFIKSGNVFRLQNIGIGFFAVYELEDGLFGFLNKFVSDEFVCNCCLNPISLQLVALAKRDDKGSYTFKSSFGSGEPYLRASSAPNTIELNLKTKSCFFERNGGADVAKCEILSPPDSYNLLFTGSRRVQQTFEAEMADKKKHPHYLRNLKTCKFIK